MIRRLAIFAFAFVLSSGCAIAAMPPKGGMPPLPPQPKVRPAGIPAGFVMVSPCVQGMGEHWANLKTAMLPNGAMGPIYGSYQGKAIFSEVMVPVTTFQKGFNYYNLTALPGYHIDHINIEYHPHGHQGMPIPHYDIHAYYISHAAQLKVCPNGAPDPDMEKTAK
ncbi:MAG TPA: hypothetical protein VKT72_17350 [Candidatus Baltobacteraceae bacterium]|nr:hypothetical protein [Candidatus Baltobacteraceae bacterium]